MKSEKLIEEATRRLVENFSPLRIILFGSRARGTSDARSDYDFLVICPVSGSRRSLMLAMDRSLKGLRIPVDIIVLSPEEFETDKHIPGTVARPAWKEGRTLYEVQ